MTTDTNDSTNEIVELIGKINECTKVQAGIEIRLIEGEITAFHDYDLKLFVGLKYGQLTWYEVIPSPSKPIWDAQGVLNASLYYQFPPTDRIEHRAYAVSVSISGQALQRDPHGFIVHIASEFVAGWRDAEANDKARRVYDALSEADQATMRTLIGVPYLRLSLPSDFDYMHLFDGFGNEHKSLKPNVDQDEMIHVWERYRALASTNLVRVETWHANANVALTETGLAVRRYLLTQRKAEGQQ